MSTLLPPSLIDHKHALRDTEIIVGSAYINLMLAKNIDLIDATEPEDDEDQGSEVLALDESLIQLEKEKAELLIDELTKSNYLIDVWVSDPEGEDGGFWTSRKPQIGDIVMVPRDWAIDRESQEPCDPRESKTLMREVNTPDSNPFTPLGWAEDEIHVKVTLFDVIENLRPSIPGLKPRTIEYFDYLSTWGTIRYDNSLYNWAKRLGLTGFELLVDIAKDRMRQTKKYKGWHFEWACKGTFITYKEKYSRLMQEDNLWWVESVNELKSYANT